MLSAGQPPVTPALVNSPSSVPVTKAHIMPDLEPNGTSTHAAMRTQSNQLSPIQHIWVVTGPAGCGKSTVGQAIRQELNLPFLEGDDVRENTLMNVKKAPSLEMHPTIQEQQRTKANAIPHSTTPNPTRTR